MGGGSKADRREPSRNPLSAAPDRKFADTFQPGKTFPETSNQCVRSTENYRPRTDQQITKPRSGAAVNGWRE